MEFVSIREVRNNPGKVWKRLDVIDPLVLTSNGKPVAILTRSRPEHMEETLRIIRAAKAQAAVRSMRVERKPLSIGGINREIAQVRRSR